MFNLDYIKQGIADFTGPMNYWWNEWRTYSVFVPIASTIVQMDACLRYIPDTVVKCEVVKQAFQNEITDQDKERVLENNWMHNRLVCRICARHLQGSLVQFLVAGAAHFLLSGRMKTVAALVSLLAMSQVFHIVMFAQNVRLPVIDWQKLTHSITFTVDDKELPPQVQSKTTLMGYYMNGFGESVTNKLPL